jgi:glutamate racemase
VAAFLLEREAAAPGPEPGRLDLLVTDLPKSFADVARRFLGANVPQVTQIDL